MLGQRLEKQFIVLKHELFKVLNCKHHKISTHFARHREQNQSTDLQIHNVLIWINVGMWIY